MGSVQGKFKYNLEHANVIDSGVKVLERVYRRFRLEYHRENEGDLSRIPMRE